MGLRLLHTRPARSGVRRLPPPSLALGLDLTVTIYLAKAGRRRIQNECVSRDVEVGRWNIV